MLRCYIVCFFPAEDGILDSALSRGLVNVFKGQVLAAYGWLLLLALASLVTMLLLLRGDSGASVLFLQLFGMMVPVPLLMGFGSSWWLLRRRNSL